MEQGRTAAPGRARQLATAAVLLALVVSAFEGTVVTTAMPTLTAALGGRALYAWVFTAFLLASTLGVLVSGGLADTVGRRATFMGGMGLFLGGSMLCGLAQSVPMLIGFRVIQGLGAGAIQPTTMTISADLYTLEERATVQSVFTGAWGLANVLGPVLGGFIAMHASWRWVFLVNVPVGLLAVALLHRSYRDPARTGASRVELVGPVLAGASMALLLLVLEPAGLGTAGRVLLLCAGAGVVGALVGQQRATLRPVLPPELFRDRTVVAGLVGGGVAGALLYGTSAYVPLWMVTHAHRTALTAGLALVPMLVGWAIGSSFGVKVLLRGGLRASAAGGFAVATVGAVLLTLALLRGWSDAALFASIGLLGLGLGPAASTSILAPQARVPWVQRGAITSSVYAARMLGGSVAIALLATARGNPGVQLPLLAGVALLGTVILARIAPAGPMSEAAAATAPLVE